jgi:hypothetical protein
VPAFGQVLTLCHVKSEAEQSHAVYLSSARNTIGSPIKGVVKRKNTSPSGPHAQNPLPTRD